jgi:hypothetical protein
MNSNVSIYKDIIMFFSNKIEEINDFIYADVADVIIFNSVLEYYRENIAFTQTALT